MKNRTSSRTRSREYLITDRPISAICAFSLPIMLGNLFQQFYTIADSVILGRFVSENALAAVGASGALTHVFICIAIGGGTGSAVLVGRWFGAREYGRMRLTVSTILLSFLNLSLLLSVVGFFLHQSLLELLRTPPELLPMAASYLQIYFLGLPFLFLYNVLSALFHALGRSRIPLYLLLFSSLLNITLDLTLVCGFHLGVVGAAWATLFSQGFSVLLSFLLFLQVLRSCTRDVVGPLSLFSPGEFQEICKVALPSIFQQSTVSIGTLLTQSVINPFGAQVLAGYSAASRVESLCIVPLSALGTAMSSYTAQNLGAALSAPGSVSRSGQPEPDPDSLDRAKKRVRQGYHASLRLTAGIAVLLCLFLEFFAPFLIRCFLGSEGTSAALSTGVGYLRFLGFFFALLGLKLCTDGILRGAADMGSFTLANLVNLTFRVAFAALTAPRLGPAYVWYAIPLGWLLNFLISWRAYRLGKWTPSSAP